MAGSARLRNRPETFRFPSRQPPERPSQGPLARLALERSSAPGVRVMTTIQHKIGSGFGARSTADEVLSGIDLSGSTAIVTGGYSGLGPETTRALAAAGAHVIVPARRRAAAQKAVRGIDGAETDDLDLSALDSVRGFADRFLATGRTIDTVINNAGVMACPETRVGRRVLRGLRHRRAGSRRNGRGRARTRDRPRTGCAPVGTVGRAHGRRRVQGGSLQPEASDTRQPSSLRLRQPPKGTAPDSGSVPSPEPQLLPKVRSRRGSSRSQ